MRWLDSITNSMHVNLRKLGDSERQGSLACCSPWGHKELDTTQQTSFFVPVTLSLLAHCKALCELEILCPILQIGKPRPQAGGALPSCQASLQIEVLLYVDCIPAPGSTPDWRIRLSFSDSPGKKTGVGYHFLLQGIFPTQGSLTSPALTGGYFTTSATWEALCVEFSSVSHIWLFVTPWTEACQGSLSITNSQSLLKLMSIESVMPSNHLILYRPLLFLSSVFASITVLCRVTFLNS